MVEVVVLAHVHQIFICADTTKETGGRERETKKKEEEEDEEKKKGNRNRC